MSPTLSMNDEHLEEVHLHKHLGVTIMNNLKWNEHIENLTESQPLFICTQCLKYKLDHNTIEKKYFALTQSR